MFDTVIFDNDGVLINSNLLWQEGGLANEMFVQIVGEEITQRVLAKLTFGYNPKLFYETAVVEGHAGSLEDFYQAHNNFAIKNVYPKAPLTEGIEDLVAYLVRNKIKLACVSSGMKDWMEIVLDRIGFRENFQFVLSVDNHKDFKPKPSPDGYIETIKRLNSDTKNVLIIEDSNTGIQSAKGSGAYVVGLSQNLKEEDKKNLKGADIYLDSIDEVIGIL